MSYDRRTFLQMSAALAAGVTIPRLALATVYDYQLLGGVVDPTQAWINNYGDSYFHEVGNGSWRVSFTPSAPGKIAVHAVLSKHRMGDGAERTRLYSKARLVRVSPTYKSDLASYAESIWESFYSTLRFLDCPMTLLLAADITEQAVGLVHTFAVEHLAGDGVRGEVCYGSPMVIYG